MKKRILLLLVAIILAWNFGQVLLEAVGASIPWAGILFMFLMPNGLMSQTLDFYPKFIVGIVLFFLLLSVSGYLFGFALPRGQKYQTTRALRTVQGLFADLSIIGFFFLLVPYIFLSLYGWGSFVAEPTGLERFAMRAYAVVGREYSRNMDKASIFVSFTKANWFIFLPIALALYGLTRGLIKRMVVAIHGRVLGFFETGRFGAGGSARFAGLFEEWALRLSFRKGKKEKCIPFFGTSLYSPFLNIGIKGDSHITTIASARSGKGTAVIIPNLLTWEGSAIVVDPKGTNAAVTRRARENMGQKVRVIDPFNILGNGSSGFDPLATLIDDLKNDSNRIREDIGILAEALVIPDETGQNAHWDQNAKAVIAGLIAHLISWPFYQAQNPTLPMIRDLLAASGEDFDMLLDDMSGNQEAGRLARDTGTKLIRGLETEEVMNILSNVDKHTDWLASDMIQDVLAQDSFRFLELKEKPTTVYLVVPPELLDEHKRFIRMFINMAISAMPKGGRSPVHVLMMLDEFQQLGRMAEVEKAYRLMAGYNFTIWSFFQDYSGLELYGNSANTFISNSRAVQVFGLSDLKSLEFINKKIGGRSTRSLTGTDASHSVPLRTTDEVEKEISVDGNQQYILRSGKAPLVIGKRKYFDDQKGLFARLFAGRPYTGGLRSEELREVRALTGVTGAGWGMLDNLYPFRGIYDQDPDYKQLVTRS